MASSAPLTTSWIRDIVNTHRPDLGEYEGIYKHLHAHPELSFVEQSTRALIDAELRKHGNGMTIRPAIGRTGLAAVLRNGSGPTVMLRADMDALPVREQTGLAYASVQKMADVDGIEQPVMHACGHDMHVASLLGAAHLLSNARGQWAGTVILIFQPAEEKGQGAQAMVDDGL